MATTTKQEQEKGVKLEDLMNTTTGEVFEEQEEENEKKVVGVELPLHCEAFKSNGQVYHSFFVPVTVFGQAIKIELRPKVDYGKSDRNAYVLLTNMFETVKNRTGKMIGTLTCRESTYKDDSGKRKKSMSYEMSEKSPEGFVVSVALTPYGDSNKKMLAELFRQKSEIVSD